MVKLNKRLRSRLEKAAQAVEAVEHQVREVLEVAPPESVDPAGVVTELVRDAVGCLTGAKMHLATAIDEYRRQRKQQEQQQ